MPLTKQDLTDNGAAYDWNCTLEYDMPPELRGELPLVIDNGYDVLDFLNALDETYCLSPEILRTIEDALQRKVPATKEGRDTLAQWFITVLELKAKA